MPVSYRHHIVFGNIYLIGPRQLRAALFLLVALNSQALSLHVHNPIGVPYVMEALFSLLLCYTALLVVPRMLARTAAYRLDLAVLFIFAFVWLASAVFAHITYGQPIVYGLIEERRAIGILIYFPLVDALRSRLVTNDDIFRWIVGISLACVAYSLLILAGVAPWARELDRATNNVRANRMSIGLYYMVLSYFICLAASKFKGDLRWGVLALVFLMSVIMIAQTRQVMIAMLFVTLVFYGSDVRMLIRVALVLAVLAVLAVFLLPEMVAEVQGRYLSLFSELSTEEYIYQSSRALTLVTIVTEFLDNPFAAHGALSLMWNNGFARIYGPTFFLADVGIFGTFFRYGLLAVPLLAFFVYTVLRLIRRLMPDDHSVAVKTSICFLFLIIPTAGILEYRAYLIGILMAAAVAVRREDDAIMAPASTC